MSKIEVDQVDPATGTDLTIGSSGDTIKTGGNLDTNDKNIVTASNRDLNLYPNGTGAVEVGGNTNPGTIILNCESNSHGIKLQSPVHSAGQSYTLKFPTGNITAGTVLKVESVSGSGTTGIGQLSFGTVSSDYVKIAQTIVTSSTASVTFQHGSGGVVIDSTYKNYVVVIQNTYGVVQGDTMRIRVGVGGTIRTSNYKVEAFRSYYSGGTSRGSRTDSIFSPQGGVEDSVHGEQISEVVLNNLPDANFKTSAMGIAALMDGDDSATDQVNQGISGGIYLTAEANDTINLFYGGGNIAKGTFSLYGRK